MRIAIAGLGDLGRRLARRLRDAGHAVLGLRRSAARVEPGIETMAVDVGRLAPAALADWRADALVVALSPDERSAAGYRRTYVDSLPALATACGTSLSRSLWVSSTAVFGDEDGDWVDEDTPAHPSRWNGALLLEAERHARALLPGLIVARPSGLYGPGRERLLQRALAGEPGDGRWTNRIHVDDAAAALHHLIELDSPSSLYCLNDDQPAPEHVVLAGLRALHALPPVPADDTRPRGRRISNARLRASGWTPVHPGWREGYAAMQVNPSAS